MAKSVVPPTFFRRSIGDHVQLSATPIGDHVQLFPDHAQLHPLTLPYILPTLALERQPAEDRRQNQTTVAEPYDRHQN